MLQLKCIICQREFKVKPYRKGAKFCSSKCYGISEKGKIPKSAFKKGHHSSPKTEFQKGEKHRYFGISSPALGKHWKLSETSKKRMSIAQTGVKRPRGKDNKRWIKDRTKLKTKGERRSSAYKNWRKEVWTRDGYICRLKNPDCNGKIEAHHILSFTKYPELRYVVKNGITLCKYHHPRKRKDEEEMIPIFQNMSL